MAPREERVPSRTIASLFDVDERTIKRWVADGCPHRKVSNRTQFLLSEVIPWRRKQDKAESRASDAPDLAKEQARKMRADAELSELKVAERRGDLVAAAQVEARMERLCMMVRARVLGVRGRWAPKVLGLGTMAEATAALDALTADVLAALRDGADDLEEEEETTPEGEVAA